jgi:small subunit ribosomal protein S20
MANHASAKKASRRSEKRALINKSTLSRIKTFMKKAFLAIDSGTKDVANLAVSEAQSEIMSAVSKGVLKINTASRKVSRMARRFKSISS